MKILLFSTFVVALSEMGDKTQLLAFSLVCRFRRPWIILAGILASSILNHALAAYLGSWIGAHFSRVTTTIVLGLSFLFFAGWTLRPEKSDGTSRELGWGAFLSTAALFFMAEMGDKTQLATAALAVKYESPGLVTLGSTCGMLISDALAIFLGERLIRRVPLRAVRWASAGVFVSFGIWQLLSV